MKYIEHRRHAQRFKPGRHLNQKGINMARTLGEKSQKFDIVITSPKSRAIETAIAMGFAVDQTWSELWDIDDPDFNYIGSFRFFQKILENGNMNTYRERMRVLFKEVIRSLPIEGKSLIISHLGVVEACSVILYPSYDYSNVDSSSDYCTGTRIWFEDEKPKKIEFLSNA